MMVLFLSKRVSIYFNHSYHCACKVVQNNYLKWFMRRVLGLAWGVWFQACKYNPEGLLVSSGKFYVSYNILTDQLTGN